MDDIDIIKQAIKTYGIDAQVLMAIEEMSELTKALCKERRTRNSDDLAVRVRLLITSQKKLQTFRLCSTRYDIYLASIPKP